MAVAMVVVTAVAMVADMVAMAVTVVGAARAGAAAGMAASISASPAYVGVQEECYKVRKRVFVPGVGHVWKRVVVCD